MPNTPPLISEEEIRSSIQPLDQSADMQFQKLTLEDCEIELAYLKTVTDAKAIHEQLVKVFYEMNNINRFSSYIESHTGFKEIQSAKQVMEDVLCGFVVIFVFNKAYLVELSMFRYNDSEDASVETTIQGPQKALSEDILVNLNLLRHRYHNQTLRIENAPPIGGANRLKSVLLYDTKAVDEQLLKEVKEKLSNLDNSLIQSIGQLQRVFSMGKKTLFPIYMITERPDRIIYNIARGKVVLLLEGTSFALVMPAVFYDFMSSMEDLYQPYWVAKFLTILRYTGLIISLILPGVYIGITSYNPEVFRVQLALSIAGSRAAVPYPSFLEVLFMLFMMEMLVEASIRLPKTIGPTATTVGGLILGQAATEAGLVSNIMIIIVSAVAISNFVVPINEMSFAMRVVKYIFIVAASLFGLIGVVISLLGLIMYLVNLSSFGQPYFRIYFSENMTIPKNE
ncbi:spore germination protein [Bacillus sp. HMF5848]|uniref:spore germination protein n=1 Tax=Bacillus sp. HMF5848 TaxID=2495421 RepID=UPI000F7ADDBE|nr:spore germination protein [Bacillus sp. HMF5848]RSK26217.1 spore germination protein [Bacillus sp. HMF5848]